MAESSRTHGHTKKEVHETCIAFVCKTHWHYVFLAKKCHTFLWLHFSQNNSLVFRWRQKSSICTLEWAEVLILFVNTLTLCAMCIAFMCSSWLSYNPRSRKIWQHFFSPFQIIPIVFLLLLISRTSIFRLRSLTSSMCVCCVMLSWVGFVVLCAIWPYELLGFVSNWSTYNHNRRSRFN